MEEQIGKLADLCQQMNFTFTIQFWHGDWNVWVYDHNVGIHKEVAFHSDTDLSIALLEVSTRIDK